QRGRPLAQLPDVLPAYPSAKPCDEGVVPARFKGQHPNGSLSLPRYLSAPGAWHGASQSRRGMSGGPKQTANQEAKGNLKSIERATTVTPSRCSADGQRGSRQE